jgi:hypothetical protein
MSDPFFVKDCALIAIANGEKAQNLRELRDRLKMTPVACIYYHFWGGMLRPRFDDPEYQNDFASWAAHSLHDKILAERLSSIDPTAFGSLEELRQAVIEIIENRLDESEIVLWADVDKQFYFVRSQIVVFDTGVIINDPKDLRLMMPVLSLGSIFYHFIDARRRTADGADDFTEWLLGFEERYSKLISRIAVIDPYFNTLSELRDALNASFNECMTARID